MEQTTEMALKTLVQIACHWLGTQDLDGVPLRSFSAGKDAFGRPYYVKLKMVPERNWEAGKDSVQAEVTPDD